MRTVDEMVAMGFDDELAAVSGDLTEQSPECCLRTWVQMNLRLLKQVKVGGGRRRQELGHDGQYLTDSIPHINQITERTLEAFGSFPDLNLKRIAPVFPR